MKIKLPEFRPFDEDMIGEYITGEGLYFHSTPVRNDFPFECWVMSDSGYGDTNNEVMYGYIGFSDSDTHFVETDNVSLQQLKSGKTKRSEFKKAYNIIIKQLKDRYVEWVKENIFENKEKEE